MKATILASTLVLTGCGLIGGVEEKELVQDATPGYYDLDRPGRPPSRPASSPQTFEGKTLWFAMRRFYFGISKRGTDERDPDAWKTIGWDLDGVPTTAEQATSGATGICLPSDNPHWHADGLDGRDNAMGASFFQLVGDLDPHGELVTNEGLELGASTLILALHDVNDLENDDHVPATIYISTHDKATGPAPQWDGTDVRRITTASFWPGSSDPFTVFSEGYVSGGVWVSGDQHRTELTLRMPFYPGKSPAAVLLRLRGRSGWLTATIGGGAGGLGTFGFNATMQEIRDALGDLIRRSGEPSVCSAASGADKILDMFQTAVDTQSTYTWEPEPTRECDSMSWGLDIEWAPIAHADVLAPVDEPVLEPCP